ncbi:hypothetical protein E1B28_006478 [Marasmius oreades]|uniref:Uncharacterized protein n=1 Tax=Marasmius oreades TaxID=181124 RepID=A0A9P7S8H0_9AGAR|nr:uncharacterized protein E1B28_006478 [Marasmius oreades]KAG7095773.1 hypothetical protein E1B28_006478 [Marasmius oreades]
MVRFRLLVHNTHSAPGDEAKGTYTGFIALVSYVEILPTLAPFMIIKVFSFMCTRVLGRCSLGISMFRPVDAKYLSWLLRLVRSFGDRYRLAAACRGVGHSHHQQSKQR